MGLTHQVADAASAERNGHGVLPFAHERIRVAGKFFSRGTEPVRLHGITYGPFPPNAAGHPFPDCEGVAQDFDRMRDAGINSVRTYNLPPEWLLHLADEKQLGVFLDVPWPKHLCFLDSKQAQRDARAEVRRAARQGARHACVAAYSIGNEIPANIVRWHGARRVERFLTELCDVAKQADPHGLVTYANYPPTEYLDLFFLDFVTFNVYLHDRETFRRYLFRLLNLVGDKPLLLGELGMDTFRHGELAQAAFLGGHVRDALLLGLAGVFVFSWTDEWFTGGHRIEDWAFGITHADRQPKASYHALREVFESRSLTAHLPATPRVSVVVCTYNGGRTLEQCLRSLEALDYPDYEVIVVDDGSTDDAPAILARFPGVRVVRQANHGLSFARNVGLRLATGSVVAYTDSDCFADPDWLTHLMERLEDSGAAAVGGPNLSPEDGRLAACVAACPGQPMHVLESDQVAEHIPGCNMAFRREALETINGFDYQYRKAGDDVDVCWRLQQAGHWITFAPGAFVWHHRRQTPRTYLRQQAGYGEAEALLRFKHPDRFNGRGDGKWRGVLYGASLQGLRLAQDIIYRGTFGTGLFQCVYQPGPAHWAMLPSTLEWHVVLALVGLAGLLWPLAWLGAGVMLALSLLVACLQGAQAKLARHHDGFRARCLVMLLCYLQPLVRSWARYRTRLLAYRLPRADMGYLREPCRGLPLSGRLTSAYWSEDSYDRTELLGLVIAYLNERGWGKAVDSGWSDWDVEIYCHPWTIVRVSTAQEDHGAGRYLIRVRYRLRPAGHTKCLFGLALLVGGAAAVLQAWPAGLLAGVFLALCGVIWWRGTRRGSQALAVFDALGSQLGLIPCDLSDRTTRPAPAAGPSLAVGEAVKESDTAQAPALAAVATVEIPVGDKELHGLARLFEQQ
jgi:GT2 family glycosyltransferase